MVMEPVEVYNFTYHFLPMAVPELGIEDFNEGIGKAINAVVDIGSKVLDKRNEFGY